MGPNNVAEGNLGGERAVNGENIGINFEREILNERLNTEPNVPPAIVLPINCQKFAESQASRNINESAVLVKSLCKRFDKNGPLVLNNLCMNVRRRAIYGLLGSSGCGKTTALSCIVGLKSFESGEILVFGESPTAKSNSILGNRLGYVPQDTALYDHLSIKENIQYYGRLYGMSEYLISEQWTLLVNLLQLPSKFKLVNQLSGGQKRRTSLALALVHQPELLILDEPTVGLDPLLRESVWKHLYNLVETRGTTIIITTHYIEETRNSDMIGVMRHGRLLVEDSPSNLMIKHNTDLLEDVVLKLCWAQTYQAKENNHGQTSVPMSQTNMLSVNNNINTSKPGSSPRFQNKWKPDKDASNLPVFEENCSMWGSYNQGLQFDSFSPTNDVNMLIRKTYPTYKSQCVGNVLMFWQKVLACCVVIYWSMIRHPVVFLAALILPAIEVLLTISTVGTEPLGLPMAVVNEEFPDWINICSHERNRNITLNISNPEGVHCQLNELSCKYIHVLEQHEILKLVPYDSIQAALEGVQKGNIWGYIHFKSNYSQHVLDRLTTYRFASNESIVGSIVDIRMDQSHFLNFFLIMKNILSGFQEYLNQIIVSCGIAEGRQTEVPLFYREPVYGSLVDNYHSYVVPGVLANIMFFMPMGISALLFINDMKMGTLARARVAGIKTIEVMTAHAIAQGSIVIIQIAICSLCLKFGFDFQIAGSTFLYLGLTFLIGMSGQAFGIFLGIFTQDEIHALIIAIFMLPTMLLFGGVVWPMDCMRPVYKYIGLTLPGTLITESIRSIAIRAVGITHSFIWPGILVTGAWCVLFWLMALVAYKVCVK